MSLRAIKEVGYIRVNYDSAYSLDNRKVIYKVIAISTLRCYTRTIHNKNVQAWINNKLQVLIKLLIY